MGFFSPIISAAVTANNAQMSFAERMAAPVDISEHGHLIDYLFNYTTWANLVFFFFVCVGVFGFSWVYRSNKHPKALYTHGNKKPHIIITAVIASLVFIFIDMKITGQSNDDYIDVFTKWPKEDQKPVTIEVLAQQWAWHFRYAGKDGVFNTEDDIVQLNDLRLPINRPVVFQILSKDVIHALYFPNARRKVDAIPGRVTRMWWKPLKEGDWDIACAEMCGTYHYRMKAHLTTYSESDYQEWLAEASEKALQENDIENPELFWGWKWQW